MIQTEHSRPHQGFSFPSAHTHSLSLHQQFTSHFGLEWSQLVKGFSVCLLPLCSQEFFRGLLAALWSAASSKALQGSRAQKNPRLWPLHRADMEQLEGSCLPPTPKFREKLSKHCKGALGPLGLVLTAVVLESAVLLLPQPLDRTMTRDICLVWACVCVCVAHHTYSSTMVVDTAVPSS